MTRNHQAGKVLLYVLTGIALVVGVLIAIAWVTRTPLYTLQAAEQPECVTSATDQDVLVGLAVSGGGSRAALFAAGAFEALSKIRIGPDQRSLLEQVSYVSSVSGGSMASSYFVARKPGRTVPMLTRDGALTQEYQAFFSRFKEDMKFDLEGLIFRRQLFRLRWINPAWTAWSLAELLDESYLDGMTFKDLAQREAQGDSPRLLINTTLYNNGRRFVVSTLPRAASQYDVFLDLKRLPVSHQMDEESEQILRARWESLHSVTPEDIKLDTCPVRVAAAVVGSMSFPPIVGPISFKVKGQDKYWHVGDGGLADNTGAESLLMIFLKKLQEGKAKRALIISFDSSFPFLIGGEELSNRAEGFTLFSYDFSRIPSIMEERAAAYRSWFFRIAQRQGLLPDLGRLGLITLRHTDAEWKDDMSELPESCRTNESHMTKPREVVRRLAGIATRLWLASPCDRDLTVAAAAKVVAQNEERIKRYLEAPFNEVKPKRL
ncbi:MAG TPA: patatin-like phospholipase family protein [Nitrospiraceae bacterium]|nr:patatin-like phospholipase family protein [Nitrospira sp.]HSF65972.1 patatin-like phospholipase family protein [Nitrospiraceae bacterium]